VAAADLGIDRAISPRRPSREGDGELAAASPSPAAAPAAGARAGGMADLDGRRRSEVVGEADLAVVVRVGVLVLGTAQTREALRSQDNKPDESARTECRGKGQRE
jgi:hypothetical protein